MPRHTRRSLKMLQHPATKTENLAGRPSTSLKHQSHEETIEEVEVKKKSVLKEKETQVNLETEISANDLTNPEGPSERYWQILAEKRQVALQESLEENENLRKLIEDLKQDNVQYKQMLDEANSFVEVINEELTNASKDDTGIDVNEVSTADEHNEEANNLEEELANASNDNTGIDVNEVSTADEHNEANNAEEELANASKDDTGIDVNEVSTADEHNEEANNLEVCYNNLTYK